MASTRAQWVAEDGQDWGRRMPPRSRCHDQERPPPPPVVGRPRGTGAGAGLPVFGGLGGCTEAGWPPSVSEAATMVERGAMKPWGEQPPSTTR